MITIIETMVVNRAIDPQSIVAIYPKGHPKYPEGHDETMLESLQSKIYARTDIALINCYQEKPYKHLWQVAIFLDKEGKPDYREYKQYFSLSERAEIVRDAKALKDLIKIHPEYSIYLRGY